jgi:hypothetical protein
MIKQLRPFYTPEELAELYAEPYDHTRWEQHRERVGRTTELLDWLASKVDAHTVADLSCGDGAIVYGSTHPWDRRHLGDVKPPANTWWLTGTDRADDHVIPDVDVFVLSETLEHVERPAELLAAIRQKARHLLLSTPYAEFDDRNPEHYWGWDSTGIRELLDGAGWRPDHFELFTPQSGNWYTYQIWTCS